MAEVKKKRILVHSLIFPPDQVSTSYLYGDLVKSFLDAGYEVLVLTTYPHYNFDGDFSLESKKGFIWRKTNFHGAKVFHFPQQKSKSTLKRAGYILAFHLAFLIKALSVKKPHLIITPSPPLTSGFLSGLVGRLRMSRVIYNVQEVYPDVLLKQGKLSSPIILSLLKQLERWTYKLSDNVVTIDGHFSKTIKDRMKTGKLMCIPNFIDTDLYAPYTGTIAKDIKFEGKYLIGYVGNLGKVQDWNAILESAEILSTKPEYHFLLIGGGSEFNFLKSKSDQLSNVTVMNYQPRERVPEINSRIDVHIIAMTEASDYDGLPSKAYAILSSGRPILASTNSNSPLSKLVKSSGNGIVVKRNSAHAIAEGIKSLKKGFLPDEASEKGRSFVLNGFSKQVVTAKYVQLVNGLLS